MISPHPSYVAAISTRVLGVLRHLEIIGGLSEQNKSVTTDHYDGAVRVRWGEVGVSYIPDSMFRPCNWSVEYAAKWILRELHRCRGQHDPVYLKSCELAALGISMAVDQ